MMSRAQVALALLLVCSSLVFAGPKDDFSSPKAAATSFLNSLKDADEAAARNATVGSKDQQDLLAGSIQMIAATRKLAEVAKAKYGADETVKAFGPDIMGTNESFDKEIVRLNEAEVKIEGDKATITPAPPKDEASSQPGSTSQPRPAAAEKPLKLQKVDGKWKVDLAASEMGGPGQPPAEQQIKMIETMSKSVQQTAQDITAGQYKTAMEARQAMMANLMMQLQQAQAAASRPTSGPTSAPAK
jgi:hypothetical protein